MPARAYGAGNHWDTWAKWDSALKNKGNSVSHLPVMSQWHWDTYALVTARPVDR